MKNPEETASEVNEWITERIKSPLEYVNDKKLEYRARIDGNVETMRSELTQLSRQMSAAFRSPKWKILARQLEAKMTEIQENLDRLRGASIGSWEEIKFGIESNLAFIKKHLAKMTSLDKRRV